VNPSLLSLAASIVVLAGAHAWLGDRIVLPRLFAVPGVWERLYLAPTPRLKLMFRLAWQLGTIGILWLGVLVSGGWWLASPHRRMLLEAPTVLMVASPTILGTFLGGLLSSKLGRPSIGLTICLWLMLALVLVIAWRSA
jgi:hypothetical protein